MKINVLEVRYAPTREGPWGEAAPVNRVIQDPEEWGEPHQHPIHKNRWEQMRVVEYTRDDRKPGAEVPTAEELRELNALRHHPSGPDWTHRASGSERTEDRLECWQAVRRGGGREVSAGERWARELLGELLYLEWTPSRELAKATGCPRASVPPIMNRLLESGRVERRGRGVIGDGYEWRRAR